MYLILFRRGLAAAEVILPAETILVVPWSGVISAEDAAAQLQADTCVPTTQLCLGSAVVAAQLTCVRGLALLHIGNKLPSSLASMKCHLFLCRPGAAPSTRCSPAVAMGECLGAAWQCMATAAGAVLAAASLSH